jgi:2,5-diketo-D-gluconate reductase A
MNDFATPTLKLNDGRLMPQLGFGTYKIAQNDAERAVRQAIECGYKLVDTAALYRNEEGVGAALAGQDDVFLTTKIWNTDQGYREAREAFQRSLDRLGRSRLDLVLIHWPCPDQAKFVDTWKAFIDLRELGKVASIGVSNFRAAELEAIITETGVKPVLNQIELHPAFQQRALCKLHEEQGIVTQSWSPLGQGDSMKEGPIRKIADEIGQPPAAVVLAWHMHHGLAPIPKASLRGHLEANFAALNLTLGEEQVAAIDALDDPDGRIGPDPATFC